MGIAIKIKKPVEPTDTTSTPKPPIKTAEKKSEILKDVDFSKVNLER